MTLSLARLDPTGADRADLVDLLTRQDWPFHVERRPIAAQVAEAIDAGAYRSADRDTFWLVGDAGERVGIARLEDLTDGAPLFDLRLDASARGRGLGAAALRALTDHVFTTMPEVDRFEGQTREDNIAMRKTFVRCGFVKEAHYRRGWPVEGGEPVASVAYAILRQDWTTGRTTPVTWDDLPLLRLCVVAPRLGEAVEQAAGVRGYAQEVGGLGEGVELRPRTSTASPRGDVIATWQASSLTCSMSRGRFLRASFAVIDMGLLPVGMGLVMVRRVCSPWREAQ